VGPQGGPGAEAAAAGGARRTTRGRPPGLVGRRRRRSLPRGVRRGVHHRPHEAGVRGARPAKQGVSFVCRTHAAPRYARRSPRRWRLTPIARTRRRTGSTRPRGGGKGVGRWWRVTGGWRVAVGAGRGSKANFMMFFTGKKLKIKKFSPPPAGGGAGPCTPWRKDGAGRARELFPKGLVL
jgi:hypothetical protein